MPDQKEAARLWNKMQELERMPPGAGEDALEFAKWKEREMKPLREAYKKATGLSCDPHNKKEQEAIRDANVFGNLRPGAAPTADQL